MGLIRKSFNVVGFAVIVVLLWERLTDPRKKPLSVDEVDMLVDGLHLDTMQRIQLKNRLVHKNLMEHGVVRYRR